MIYLVIKSKGEPMPKKRKNKQEFEDKRVFFAVALIFIGSLLLARNLGLIPDKMAELWPVILVLLGLLGLSNVLR